MLSKCKHGLVKDHCAACATVAQLVQDAHKKDRCPHGVDIEKYLCDTCDAKEIETMSTATSTKGKEMILCPHGVYTDDSELCMLCEADEADAAEVQAEKDATTTEVWCKHGRLLDFCTFRKCMKRRKRAFQRMTAKGKVKYASEKAAHTAAGSHAITSGGIGYKGMVSWKSCTHHSEKAVVILSENRKVHACRWYHQDDWNKLEQVDVALDCRYGGSGGDRMMLPLYFQPLAKYLKGAGDNVIGIPWADRGAPPVEFGFWKALIDMMPKDSVIVCSCIGAHGRTGTAISALILADNPGISASEAIKRVRIGHCDEAVESENQVAYLKAMALSLAKDESERERIKGEDEKAGGSDIPTKVTGWSGTGYDFVT